MVRSLALNYHCTITYHRHLIATGSGDTQTFTMRADSDHQVSSDARGRDSVRISSMNAWSEMVMILNLQHMPEGCATWPAWWTLSKDGPWPNGGEIDIIEGKSSSLAFFPWTHINALFHRREYERPQLGIFAYHVKLHYAISACSYRVCANPSPCIHRTLTFYLDKQYPPTAMPPRTTIRAVAFLFPNLHLTVPALTTTAEGGTLCRSLRRTA